MTGSDPSEDRPSDPRDSLDPEDRAFLDRAKAAQQSFARRWLTDLPVSLEAWSPPWLEL